MVLPPDAEDSEFSEVDVRDVAHQTCGSADQLGVATSWLISMEIWGGLSSVL